MVIFQASPDRRENEENRYLVNMKKKQKKDYIPRDIKNVVVFIETIIGK